MAEQPTPDSNPYQSPFRESDANADNAGGGNPGALNLRCEVFRGSSFVFSTKRAMERLRREAMEFVNARGLASQVVSVHENLGFEYVVVVWYRE